MLYRMLLICLCCAVLASCAARGPEFEVVPALELEDIEEPLDEVLTEEWPDVGDVQLTELERQALEIKLDFPYPLTDYAAELIQQQFVFLTRQVPGTVRNWLQRSVPYLPYIKQEILGEGLPVELAYLAYIESGFNPRAYSRAGAAGMWQFMAPTGRRFGLQRDMWIDERRDPYKSTLAAAAYLKALHNMFGEWTLAVASYNAGEGKILKAKEATGAKDFFELAARNHTLPHSMQLRTETLEFVPRFLAMAKLVNKPEVLGYQWPDPEDAPSYEPLEIGGGVNLRGLAQAAGMSWDDFRAANPAFRRTATPPTGKFFVTIPRANEAAVLAYLAKPQPKPDYDGVGTYTVKSGDTWGRIAQRSGLSVALLKEVNNTRSDSLRVGQKIKLPLRGEALDAEDMDEAPRKGSPPARGGTHVVKRGETLSHIADRTGVPVRELMAANKLSSPQALRAGQKITIPAPQQRSARPQQPAPEPQSEQLTQATRQALSAPPPSGGQRYEVKRGETLSQIAVRSGVSVQQLMSANKLSSPQALRAGQTITIPGRTQSPANPAPAPADKPRPAQEGSKPTSPPTEEPVLQPATAKTPAQPAAARQHVVQRGETLSQIAARSGVSVQQLMSANKLSSPQALRAGQTITIPGSGPAQAPAQAAADKPRPAQTKPASDQAKPASGQATLYKVQSGDTLWSLSRRFKVKEADLLRWNNLQKNSILRPGDTLKIHN